jgi:hypothetical protein
MSLPVRKKNGRANLITINIAPFISEKPRSKNYFDAATTQFEEIQCADNTAPCAAGRGLIPSPICWMHKMRANPAVGRVHERTRKHKHKRRQPALPGSGKRGMERRGAGR